LAKKQLKNYSDYLIKGAVAGVVLAMIGYLGFDLWLASTQWLLVSAVLALFAVYLKLK